MFDKRRSGAYNGRVSSASDNAPPRPHAPRRGNAARRPAGKRPPSPAPRGYQGGEAPEGSEHWLRPWVQLKYFTYNPAVFPRMLGAVSPDAVAGGLIHVYDKNGELFGGGFWNPRSRTPLRMLRHGSEPLTEEDLREALRRAVAWRREDCVLDAATSAYRVVHGDSDGLGGLICDRYGDVLSLEVSCLGVWLRLPEWLPLLHELCGTTRHHVSVDEGIARMEGIDPAQCPESAPVHRVRIAEHGVQFEVDFDKGHKTGFFCDQRDNRKKLAQFCAGKRVLDLCCYTGGFSIAAKTLGGAAEVTGVDLDENAVAQAKRNANLNQARVNFVHADTFTYARQMQANGEKFDVVVLDPPKLINGKDDYEDGFAKYHDMNKVVLPLVKEGGLFVTNSCSGLLRVEDFEALVIRVAHRLGRRLQILDRTGPGMDHPVMSNYPEGRYLKALWAIVW